MAILNYTTQIDPHKTVGEIQRILVRHGARNIAVDYDDAGNPAALSFLVEVRDEWINFRLPSNYNGVRRAMDRDRSVPKRLKTDAQAVRVAWRIVKDWTEAQLAIIEAGLATLPEVFLPYAVAADGRTFFQHFEERGPRLLTQHTTQPESP